MKWPTAPAPKKVALEDANIASIMNVVFCFQMRLEVNDKSKELLNYEEYKQIENTSNQDLEVEKLAYVQE